MLNERNIALFQCMHFGDTSLVARRTAEPSAQKALDKLECECRADDLSAQTKYVHIVIFDALMRGEDIMDETGTHAGYLVGSNGSAHAATAQRYAALNFPPRHSSG